MDDAKYLQSFSHLKLGIEIFPKKQAFHSSDEEQQKKKLLKVINMFQLLCISTPL